MSHKNEITQSYYGHFNRHNVHLNKTLCLKYGNETEQRVGYQTIAHNLCEPARLTVISRIACDAMDRGVNFWLGTCEE